MLPDPMRTHNTDTDDTASLDSFSRHAVDGPLTRAKLTLCTISNLRRQQLLGVIERKARHAVVPRLPVDFDQWYTRRVPDPLRVSLSPLQAATDALSRCLLPRTKQSHRSDLNAFDEGTLAFIGETVELDADRTIEWENSQLSDVPLLWWLKFQSLEVLDWFLFGEGAPARSAEFVSEVLDPWLRTMVSRTTIGSSEYLRRDWIPHAVSLRIMRLCRYCAWLAANDMLATRGFILAFTYKNALFLRNHIEHDVGGNHLVENAVALLMAGLVFDDSAEWVETGEQLLVESAETQFLADGGHFERSPMYHVMVLTRYLTAVDLLDGYERPVPTRLRTTAREATVFLRDLTPPDGRIPLLNDSVFDEMLAIPEVLDYADFLGIQSDDSGSELGASGYYWLGEGADRMLVDGGAVGPPHLPGHSHVDLLSVMLWLDGQRVLTDTGVYQYVADRRRVYARSVQAHNSVRVGNSGPIEVGGQYLMGSRVDPEVVSYRNDDNGEFVGRYRTKRLFSPGYQHTRSITTDRHTWAVTDSISGEPNQPITSRLHFHPDTTVEPQGENDFSILRQSGSLLGHLTVDTHIEAELLRTPYFPRFGEQRGRDTVELGYRVGRNGFSISLPE
ncbi:alginate lyase family protein [Salinigranum marinum]|uniref:heparinase II/III family protein n=1 Tax=Salinigranum marinum TaxID=1515595 RepID=UPI002989B8E7|nr:alginate lyase family protein [Salinigranum marinum]